jgi:hypothetical protein
MHDTTNAHAHQSTPLPLPTGDGRPMAIRGVLIDLSGAWRRLCRAGAGADAVSVLNGAVAGTLHVDDAVIPGCVEALRRLLSRREIGVRFGACRLGGARDGA